jgi:hypothetical protein
VSGRVRLRHHLVEWQPAGDGMRMSAVRWFKSLRSVR